MKQETGFLAAAERAEERSDEAGSAAATAPPDPEVAAKPKRRQFTAEYRLRIVEEADRCTKPGEVGQLLRREGLYSSHLTAWRKARRNGALRGLGVEEARRQAEGAQSPGAEGAASSRPRWHVSRRSLHKAHTILDVQEKVAGLLGFSLESGKNS